MTTTALEQSLIEISQPLNRNDTGKQLKNNYLVTETESIAVELMSSTGFTFQLETKMILLTLKLLIIIFNGGSIDGFNGGSIDGIYPYT